jgi:outer membrane protein assembly factor BamB
MRDTGQSSFYRRAGAGTRSTALPRIWRPIFMQAAVLLALVVTLAGCNQASNQAAHPRATPTPTATPFPQAISNSTFAVMSIGNGVVYAGVGSNGVYALRISDGHLLWHRQIAGTVNFDPLLVNGIVYTNSSVDEGTGYIYALRASDGALLWHYDNSFSFGPIIVGNMAYIAGQSGFVVALRASDGHQLWRTNTTAPVYGAPLVMNGVVYTGSAFSYYSGNNEPGYIYALRASDGRQLWRVTTDASPTLSMARNGAVYAFTNNALFALRASDGHQIWRQSLDSPIGPQPQVVNGVMYFITTRISLEGTPTTGSTGLSSPLGSAGNLLQSVMQMAPARPHKFGISSIYAIRMDNGTVLWHYKLSPEGGNNWAQWLSVTDDGMVYAGSYVSQNKGYIYALQAGSGALVWRHATQNATPENAAVVGGVIYIGIASNGGDQTSMYAQRASDGSPFWQRPLDGPLSEAPIVLGDIVYIDTATGAMYALRASTGSVIWHYIALAG